jgi:heparanase 1
VKSLGPGVLRVGGITCDFIQYVLPNQKNTPENTPEKTPEKRNVMQYWPDFNQDLTISGFEALVEFANATNHLLLFSLNEIQGRNCHFNGQICEGTWNTSNVQEFLTYLRDKKIGGIYGFELGNEMTTYAHHITIQQNVQDYNTLNNIFTQIWPDKANRPPIYGPSIDFCDGNVATFLQGTKQFLTGFTYHTYPGQAGDKLTTQLLDINWLKNNIVLQDLHAHSEICLQSWEQIGKPVGMEIWITETSSAYTGIEGVLNAFYNGFWYLCSLGQYALTGVRRHSRWILEGGDQFTFVNVSQSTYSVLPDYWIAVLYKKLVGTKVLKATSDFNQSLVYAYCGKNSMAVTLTVVNPASVAVPLVLSGLSSLQREEYMLTAQSLSTKVPMLNGKDLYINSDGTLPPMNGVSASGQPILPPHSYGFLVFPNGGVVCK